MKNIQYVKFTLLIAVAGLILACAGQKVAINGVQYNVFPPDHGIGFIGDYSGMISGKAYDDSLSYIDYVWLNPEVKFSKYQKLTIVNLDNWTGQKAFKACDKCDEYDISEVFTVAFASEPRLRKNFKTVVRGKAEDAKDGLIIKGTVTYIGQGITCLVGTELLMVDAGTSNEIGKLIMKGESAGFHLAAGRIPTKVGDLIAAYRDKSPGFDPKALIEAQSKK